MPLIDFSEPEVILEGLHCFVRLHTLCPEQGEQNKRILRGVDYFALTSISGSPILL